MKRSWKGLLAAALTGLVLLLTGCGSRSGSAPPLPVRADPAVRLWVSEASPLCDGLLEQVEKYNALEPQAFVRVTRFADEEALAAALEEEMPELLLVNCQRMRELETRGELGALAFPPGIEPRVLPPYRALSDTVGSGFFPLGAELPVLVALRENRELLSGCESMEALCETAAEQAEERGTPFFSADSYTRVFADAMAQRGSVFHDGYGQDRSDPVFREVYNLLAGAAFDGGLQASDEAVLPRVLRGELVCGICSSRALRGADTQQLCLFPVPPMAGCAPLAESEVWGLAALPPAAQNEEWTTQFISWLCSFDHAVSAVREAGLVPAEAGDWAKDEDAFAGELLTVAEAYRLVLPGSGSGERGREEFEQSFRSALALLG